MDIKKLTLTSELTEWLMRTTSGNGVRRVASLSAAIGSDVGNVRDDNQDKAAIARGLDRFGQSFAVAAIADGIGGMKSGADCAALAVGSFIASISRQANSDSNLSKDWFIGAIRESNDAVASAFSGAGGATLVAIMIRPNLPVCWASVGDSRVYRATGNDLVQISVDDTIAGQLGKKSLIEVDQSKLLQFIGMREDLQPHIGEFNSNDVDSLLLTTDGVHYLDKNPGLIGQIINGAPDPGVCIKRLIDLSKWCGGLDNASATIFHLSSPMPALLSKSTSFLEVWDAFGDLRIPLLNFPLLPYVTQPKKSNDLFEDTVELEIGKILQNEKTPKKTVGNRTHNSQRSSNKNARAKSKLSETGVPLLMEFPTKSN
jgi:PPM family protein phosphatase